MIRIDAPARLIRTTLGEYLAGHDDVDACVYVIACYPALGVLYVGKTDDLGVRHRLRQHLNEAEYDDRVGGFLRSCFADACSFRLDMLLPPVGDGAGRWLRDAEHALIAKFAPVFNVMP